MKVSYVNKKTQEQHTFSCLKVDIDLETQTVFIYRDVNRWFKKPLDELDGSVIISED